MWQLNRSTFRQSPASSQIPAVPSPKSLKHRGGEVKHPRERSRRDEVSLSGSRCRWEPSEWCEALHGDLRERSDAARVWLLVTHAVRCAHFFVPNDIKRYSLGTKNKDLNTNADGSLTIYVQAEPLPDAQRSNWLPAPKDADFSLFIRAYWPTVAVIDGSWVPPPVRVVA